MNNARLVLIALGFVCELLATFRIPHDERWNLIAAGLACWFAASLFPL